MEWREKGESERRSKGKTRECTSTHTYLSPSAQSSMSCILLPGISKDERDNERYGGRKRQGGLRKEENCNRIRQNRT